MRKLSYPQLGNYDIPIAFFVEKGLGLQYISPPRMTKKTIDLGAKYSPDYVCAPFKFHMGCYIEAMEQGADVLIQTGGTCRLGYYGELHEQILRDLGYEFEMLNLTLFNYDDLPGLIMGIKKFVPEASWPQMISTLPAVVKMITSLDKVDDYMRKNMGFEDEPGAHEKVYKKFLKKLRRASSVSEVNAAYRQAMDSFSKIPNHKPADPLRIGIVGEYFTIMDPFSNHEVEKKIAHMGAEVHRYMNLTHSVLACPDEKTSGKIASYLQYDLHKFPSSIWEKSQRQSIKKYARYDTGASSIATIALADYYAKQGFDGLIHVKSFGCTPEMDAIPMLHNISRDYKIPFLFLSFDTQSSDTGIETRLEAFYDMVDMRKKAGGQTKTFNIGGNHLEQSLSGN